MFNRTITSLTPKSIIFVVLGLWFLGAWAFPLTQDEAYYKMWGTILDWGYFDHPPGVGFVASLGNSATDSVALFSRIGTIFVGFLSLLGCYLLFRNVGLVNKSALALALILAFGNLLGLVSGFLTTPDTPLLMAWVWALNEAVQALKGQRQRWLTAGLFTGIGLLCKYTMTLIGPVFLLGMIISDRKALKTPWPYLGGFVALLVFMPHIYWNQQNDNITFKFQLRHGFALDRPENTAFLPPPLPRSKDSDEWQLGALFDTLKEEEKSEELQPAFYDSLLKSLNRYVGYYGSQIGLWGLIAPLLLLAWFRRYFRPWQEQAHFKPQLYSQARPILWASIYVPLGVFGLISLGSKVEANWSAMYVIGAAPLLAPLLMRYEKWVYRLAGINAVVLVLALLHANTGWFASRPHRDRILLETHGYDKLSKFIAQKEGPLFADSYQITSMLRHYSNSIQVGQWPGITRDSEYTRNPTLNELSFNDLFKYGSFWLITTDQIPPRIRGFKVVRLSQLRDCLGHDIQEIVATNFNAQARCKKPIHQWYLNHYRAF